MRCALGEDLDAAIGAFAVVPVSDAQDSSERGRAAGDLIRRAIGRLDAEAWRLHRDRFAVETPESIRRRLVDDPAARAERAIAELRAQAATERTEWSRRFEKQVKDVLDAMRAELRRVELERIPSGARTRVIARSGFRARFERWGDAAMDAWTTQLSALLDARYHELVAGELEQLESVTGVRVEPTPASTSMPSGRVRIADAPYEASYEPPSIASAVLGSVKGGLDVVALLAGLIVVPLVGTMMGDAPVFARVGVVGAMVVLSFLGSIASGLRVRRRLEDEAFAEARASIVAAVEASFVAQIERFRAELERSTLAAWREAVRGTVREASRATEAFVRARESSALGLLADARTCLDRIDEQLRVNREMKRALEDELVVALRRSEVGA